MDFFAFAACSSKTITSEANINSSSERAEVKEPSDANEVTPSEFNEYPVFKYRPFIFHPIASLIKEAVESRDNIKTVGLCCNESFDDLYLEDIPRPGQACDEAPAKILLRFYCADAVPRIGANVEVFGCIQYEIINGENTPVFQVWFFRACRGNVVGYIEILLQIQQVLVDKV